MAIRLPFAPALFSREDAAEYLGVSPRKLDEFQARAFIIPADLDGMKRFRRIDLDDLAANLPDWVAKTK